MMTSGPAASRKKDDSRGPKLRSRSNSPTSRTQSISTLADSINVCSETSGTDRAVSHSKRELVSRVAAPPGDAGPAAGRRGTAGRLVSPGAKKSSQSPYPTQQQAGGTTNLVASGKAAKDADQQPASLRNGHPHSCSSAASSGRNRGTATSRVSRRSAVDTIHSPTPEGESSSLRSTKQRHAADHCNHSRHQQHLQAPQTFSCGPLLCVRPLRTTAPSGGHPGSCWQVVLLVCLCFLFLSVSVLERATRLPGYPTAAFGTGQISAVLGCEQQWQAQQQQLQQEEQEEEGRPQESMLEGSRLSAGSVRATAGGRRSLEQGGEAGPTLPGRERTIDREQSGDDPEAEASRALLTPGVGPGVDGGELGVVERHLAPVTIFSVPDPFTSDPKDPQRRALQSWLALPGVRVVLVGADKSLERVASETGGDRVEVLRGVELDLFGVPLLNSLLDAIQTHMQGQQHQQQQQEVGPSPGSLSDCAHESTPERDDPSGDGRDAGAREGDRAAGTAVAGAQATTNCSEGSGSAPRPPPVAVLVSPDATVLSDSLAAFAKLSAAFPRWIALAATRHLAENAFPPAFRPDATARSTDGARPPASAILVSEFLEQQRRIRCHVRKHGSIHPHGEIDFFAWGGSFPDPSRPAGPDADTPEANSSVMSGQGGRCGGRGAGDSDSLIPGREGVPPLSVGGANVSRWLAGAITYGVISSEGAASSAAPAPALAPSGEAEGGECAPRGGADVALVDVTDVASVVRVGHRRWDRAALRGGRPWPSGQRRTRRLVEWQKLRNAFQVALDAAPVNGSHGRAAVVAGNGGAGPQLRRQRWTDLTLGSPLSAPWELSACLERSARFLCLKRRTRPGVCRCGGSSLSLVSSSDVYPSSNGRQWLCGTNTDRMPVPEPFNLLDSGHQRPFPDDAAVAMPILSVPVSKLLSMEEVLPLVATKADAGGLRFVVLVGTTGHYNEMLMNFVCNLRRLGLERRLAVAAMDADAYQFALSQGLAVYYEGPTLASQQEAAQASSSSGAMAAAAASSKAEQQCGYRSDCFRRLTKVKSRAVLRVLRAGYAVLWTDVDIVWFSDPIPELLGFGPGVLPIQANEPHPRRPSKINSGFYFARPEAATMEAFEGIVAHAATSAKSEQPSFNHVLCQDAPPKKVRGESECRHPSGLRTVFLDRKRFANGKIYDFWQSPNVTRHCAKNGCVILHNNWIEGRDLKTKRFLKKGFWYYDTTRRLCSPSPIYRL